LNAEGDVADLLSCVGVEEQRAARTCHRGAKPAVVTPKEHDVGGRGDHVSILRYEPVLIGGIAHVGGAMVVTSARPHISAA
jgi:hypothetical protein